LKYVSKVDKVWTDLMQAGRLFHTLVPMTANALSPLLLSLVLGTDSKLESNIISL